MKRREFIAVLGGAVAWPLSARVQQPALHGRQRYHAETIDVSLAMGDLSLLPAVRSAPADAIIVADGTSCRHQIKDGAGREAIHVARLLERCVGG